MHPKLKAMQLADPAKYNKIAALIQTLGGGPEAEALAVSIISQAETVTKAAQLAGITYKAVVSAGGDDIDRAANQFAAAGRNWPNMGR